MLFIYILSGLKVDKFKRLKYVMMKNKLEIINYSCIDQKFLLFFLFTVGYCIGVFFRKSKLWLSLIHFDNVFCFPTSQVR